MAIAIIAVIIIIIIIVIILSPFLQLTGILFMAQRRIVQCTSKVQGCPPQCHPQPMTLPRPLPSITMQNEENDGRSSPAARVSYPRRPGALGGKRVACQACHSPEWQRSQVSHSLVVQPLTLLRYCVCRRHIHMPATPAAGWAAAVQLNLGPCFLDAMAAANPCNPVRPGLQCAFLPRYNDGASTAEATVSGTLSSVCVYRRGTIRLLDNDCPTLKTRHCPTTIHEA